MIIHTTGMAQGQREKVIKTVNTNQAGIDLNATIFPYYINLVWTVPQLDQSESFELQRSSDGISFNTIKLITPATYSADKYDYYYRDESPMRKNYYRIIAHGKSGAEDRTVDLVADFEGEAKAIKPTLVVDGVQLRILNHDGERLQVLIYDIQGNPMVSKIVSSNIFNIPSEMKKGVYAYQLYDEYKVQVAVGRVVVL